MLILFVIVLLNDDNRIRIDYKNEILDIGHIFLCMNSINSLCIFCDC